MEESGRDRGLAASELEGKSSSAHQPPTAGKEGVSEGAEAGGEEGQDRPTIEVPFKESKGAYIYVTGGRDRGKTLGFVGLFLSQPCPLYPKPEF